MDFWPYSAPLTDIDLEEAEEELGTNSTPSKPFSFHIKTTSKKPCFKKAIVIDSYKSNLFSTNKIVLICLIETIPLTNLEKGGIVVYQLDPETCLIVNEYSNDITVEEIHEMTIEIMEKLYINQVELVVDQKTKVVDGLSGSIGQAMIYLGKKVEIVEIESIGKYVHVDRNESFMPLVC